MRPTSWLRIGSCLLLLSWAGCLFNPQPEPPAYDSAPSDGGAGGTGAHNGALGGSAAEGGSDGDGGDEPGGLFAGQAPGVDRMPVGGSGGAGGSGGGEPAGGAGGS